MSLENDLKDTIKKGLNDVLDSIKGGEYANIKDEIKDTMFLYIEMEARTALCVDPERKAKMKEDLAHLKASLASLKGISQVAITRASKEVLVKAGTLLLQAAKSV